MTETLEERVRRDLAMTRGRMPLIMVVEDEVERGRAAAARAGQRWARLLTIVTRGEFEMRSKGG